jgi:hypothetical protein
LGQNFVLAHRQCNNDKRDFLGCVPYLKNWIARNRGHDSQKRAYFGERSLPTDLKAAESVAVWAYEQTERNGGSVWVSKGTPLVGLETGWRECF